MTYILITNNIRKMDKIRMTDIINCQNIRYPAKLFDLSMRKDKTISLKGVS